MRIVVLKRLIVLLLLTIFGSTINAQEPPLDASDTFFLSKKKGLLGKLGKSIMRDPPTAAPPVKVANPYLQFAGKTIRHIDMLSLGFERDINDTSKKEYNLGIRLANTFHKNTRRVIINNNLFFRKGDKLFPYVLADNERYLRQIEFLQDARIIVDVVPGTQDSVDVLVITKDIFSIGGEINIEGTQKWDVGVNETNFAGMGSKVSVGYLYDKEREPINGFSAAYLNRNIQGTFIDWELGGTTYNSAFNSGRNEEVEIYTRFEKPLVSAYMPWTGAVDLSFKRTSNLYTSVTDSLYKSDFMYTYFNSDAWIGYNFGTKRFLYKNIGAKVRKFVAVRGLYQHFTRLPDKYTRQYDFNYADISGVLLSFNVFQQDFYKTSFIYGFGRTEDVPVGFSGAVITGWIDKDGRKRGYYGIDGEYSHLSKNGHYTTYVLKFGGYDLRKRFEDIDLLVNVDHFTKLHKMSKNWYNRFFVNGGFTKQFKPLLNQPLYLNSKYGLPYFSNGTIQADLRAALKMEFVFFNMKKYIGFRTAPFVFSDMCVIRPTGQPLNTSELYSAFGAGIRTRNENLVFGTLQLKGYYFPRRVPGMSEWKIEFTGNLRFKYNSTFVRKPDFVVPN